MEWFTARTITRDKETGVCDPVELGSGRLQQMSRFWRGLILYQLNKLL
jgi:hypothetical protein